MEFEIAIAGIVVGFFLNVFYRSLRDTQARKRRTETSRKVVSAEISNNIELINELNDRVLCDIVDTKESSNISDNCEMYRIAILVSRLPLQECSRKVFDGLVTVLGQVLPEKKFIECIRCYHDFDRVNRIMVSLKADISRYNTNLLNSISEEDTQSSDSKVSLEQSCCYTDMHLHDLCMYVDKILERGNPLS